MCQADFEQAQAPQPATPTRCPSDAAPAGSRRRRVWELDPHAHCPVIGVCLPIAVVRRLAAKVLGGEVLADDYELHCGTAHDCKRRTAIAETVQKELDRRHALTLRRAARAKSTEELAAWWAEASAGNDLAGAFWATLTHPRCSPELERKVLGEVHMLQHQVGMARRADLARFEALIEENGVLARELGAAQQRSARRAEEHARRQEELQRQVMLLRAQLMARDSALAALQSDLQALEATAPGLKSRFELAREVERLMDERHGQQRALLHAQQEAERERRRAEELAAELRQREALATEAPAAVDEPSVSPVVSQNQAVLCVGGRPASVPIYRQLIEGTGWRFLHHDGGEEDNPAKLDATLAAADLVICQTGCISHNAYWRVKDHCKRTGKRCVFVESPSSAHLKRALLRLVPAPADAGAPSA